MSGILLVAATERELCGHQGLVCGVGPVEAAAATARALALDRPHCVLHIGVAGGRGLPPGSLVVGSEATYADLRAAIPVVDSALPDRVLLERVTAALPDALPLPITTSAAVSGPRDDRAGGIAVEAMEGFGVLRACALAGVPAIEVRAISNELGEADRSRWDVAAALRALDVVLPTLLSVLAGAAGAPRR